MAVQTNPEISPACDGKGMRLYSGPLSMFGAKAQIAVLEKGLPYELVMVPFDMQRLYEPKHPDVLRINPKRQVPVLIHGEVEIFDSTQIFEYLEDLAPAPPLWPHSAVERARARRLELQSDEVYFPHIIRLMSLQDNPSDQAAITAREAAAAYYDRMEVALANSPYLAGQYGYADIAFYMAQFFGHRMGAPIGGAHRRLIEWRRRVSSRHAVRQVIEPMADYLTSQGRSVPDWLGAPPLLRPS
jgi:glutathione S-transferase